MSRPTGWTEIDGVKCIAETADALLCIVDSEKSWIPKSVVGNDSEIQSDGDEGRLVVKEWFALKEGIE